MEWFFRKPKPPIPIPMEERKTRRAKSSLERVLKKGLKGRMMMVMMTARRGFRSWKGRDARIRSFQVGATGGRNWT